jgi:hypothetical protein
VLWLRAHRAMFDPNPNEISTQTLIPNDAWNDGSCVSDHERLESGAVQNWLGARVRAASRELCFILPHIGVAPAAPKRGRSGARKVGARNVRLECAADPPAAPGRDRRR